MPTYKQKLAYEKTVENRGHIGLAMKAAGYGKTDTTNLTKSKGWKELMTKHLDDRKLAKKHEQLLNDDKSEIQIKALDLAYKVKGKIQDTSLQETKQTIVNFNFFSNPKIREATEKLDEAFKTYLTNGDENKESLQTLQNQ